MTEPTHVGDLSVTPIPCSKRLQETPIPLETMAYNFIIKEINAEMRPFIGETRHRLPFVILVLFPTKR